jgi:hypothetical protein
MHGQNFPALYWIHCDYFVFWAEAILSLWQDCSIVRMLMLFY